MAKSMLELAEERISKLGIDRWNLGNLTTQRKRMRTNKQNVRETWDTIKCTSKHTMGLLLGRKEKK